MIVNRTGGLHGRTVTASEFMDARRTVDEELTPAVFMRIARTGK